MEPNKLLHIFNSLRTDLPLINVEQWKHRVLEIVTQQITADKANFISQLNEDPPVQLTKNTQPQFDTAYETHYHAQDPLGFLINGNNGLQLTEGPRAKDTVVSLADVVVWDEFRKTEYYNDFLFPMQIYHELVLYLKSGQRILGIVSVMRNSANQFTLCDYEMLRLLEPFLCTCLENLSLRNGKNQGNESTVRVSLCDEEKFRIMFHLSRREVDVVTGIFQGMTNAQIGESLFISESTVKKHIQNICSKLRVNRRTEIVSTILTGFGLLS